MTLSSPQVPLRPESLFEDLGSNLSLVVIACHEPTSLALALPPAVPAPVEYARTVRRFWQLGRLASTPEPFYGRSYN